MLLSKGVILWAPVVATLSGGAIYGASNSLINYLRDIEWELVTIHKGGFTEKQRLSACSYKLKGYSEDIESPVCDQTAFMKEKSSKQTNSHFEVWLRGYKDSVIDKLRQENLLEKNYEGLRESEWTTETKEICKKEETYGNNNEKIVVSCRFEEKDINSYNLELA
ncbi:hypothetical protein [Mycoplasma suis]|uniref:hypothetical protein n=1 Tax=Mycoplasma suis TaxID=57372 RepID=UPI0005C49542|nr:hypothetical protein [Mycoplasma suis]